MQLDRLRLLLVFGRFLGLSLVANSTHAADANTDKRFQLRDLFELETASDPQISPDGTKVVFVRNFSDIMKDKKRSNLWSWTSTARTCGR